MGLRIIPSDTNIAFTKFRFAALAVSAVAVLASIVSFFAIGLNLGIDFKGGVSVEVGPVEGTEFTESDLTTVRDAVSALGFGDEKVQMIGAASVDAPGGIVASVEPQTLDRDTFEGDDEEYARAVERLQNDVKVQITEAIQGAIGDRLDPERTQTSVVGPTVSGELLNAGIMAMVIAISLMLAYIWFRFEWQFSLGAILALVHDVVITIGMFALTQMEFTMSVIAALLTIIGYSMNDTVVVFDRIRENLRKFKKKPLPEVINLSINQTLARTIMTSVTTLLALLSLFIFGGEVLRGFSFALIWGIVIGTYSSIFIASPTLLATGVKRDWSASGASGTPNAPATTGAG